MKIFVSHSTSFDFEKELYSPIRESFKTGEYSFFLPEEHHVSTKQVIKDCNIFIAEVSYSSSLGSGIEIGWADAFNKPILCFYKEGAMVSNSLKYLTSNIFSYKDTNELIKLLKDKLYTFKNSKLDN